MAKTATNAVTTTALKRFTKPSLWIKILVFYVKKSYAPLINIVTKIIHGTQKSKKNKKNEKNKISVKPLRNFW
jgi:hypothetical protein